VRAFPGSTEKLIPPPVQRVPTRTTSHEPSITYMATVYAVNEIRLRATDPTRSTVRPSVEGAITTKGRMDMDVCVHHTGMGKQYYWCSTLL